MPVINDTTKPNLGLLGLGEVGSAIKKLVKSRYRVLVRELTYDHIGQQTLDILHVAIPYSQTFVNTVVDLINQAKPGLTIINSTIKPGTTAKIHHLTQANLVHAPIDGVHPHLFDYLFKFTKPIGAVNQESYQLARDHFEGLGVKTTKFHSPLETELAKILSTTYYGWNIIFEKWVHKLCQEQGANFEDVYTRYNTYYNQNYSSEKPEVTRPILKHYPGEIGGHCVISNAKIMQNWLEDEFTKFLLDQNKKLGQS